ncbi:MAG: response regulator [Balneolaceae bacterium]
MNKIQPEERYRKRRILIIEDDLILMMSLQVMLQKLGFQHIDRAETGEEAIRFALESPPDLMLVDIYLGPGISGIDAVKQIQKTAQVPVIYITGNSDELNRSLADETKHVEYLVKPISIAEISKLISKLWPEPGNE